MQTLNKHMEHPFCHFRRWILPCDSRLPPFLSAPTLSAPTCHIYQQTMILPTYILILCINLILAYYISSYFYLNNPFPDYDLTYLHYPNHILILCTNSILAYYISS